MRIGIDARLINETGVGTYIRNLLRELAAINPPHEFITYVPSDTPEDALVRSERIHYLRTDIRWHTIAEQLVMPILFLRDHLDILHVPYFNLPILYPGRMVATIHDITVFHVRTGKASTQPGIVYRLKRWGYELVMRIGLRRATAILAVSQATKRSIVEVFGIPSQKIIVTYEGVDREMRVTRSPGLARSGSDVLPVRYILYVGNAYPHKNLSVLVKAFKLIVGSGSGHRDRDRSDTILILVGPDDYFYRRLRQEVEHAGMSRHILFFGPANRFQLAQLYTNARALVFPSLMEGFGLPGIEAMAYGTPVIASDIPVFREVYGDAFLPFNPDDSEGLADAIRRVLDDPELSNELKRNGQNVVDRYSWKKMAKQTLSVYEASLRQSV